MDEDHIKNTSCTDPTDHQEHPIHKVFHCLSYLGFKRKEKEQLNKISDNFHQCNEGEPGPHVLPPGSADDALLFLPINFPVPPNNDQICPQCPYMDRPSMPHPLHPQCGQLIVTFDIPFFFHVIFVFQMCSDLFVNKPYLYRYK